MTSKRMNMVMTALVALLSVLVCYSLVWANSTLVKKSNKLVSLKLENQVADDQQSSLAQTAKDLAKYTELEKIAKAVVPQDKDQAQTVREIVKIANQSGVTLSSISFPASNLGQTVPKQTTDETGTSSTEQTKTSATSITQVKPVEGIPGVYTMEITVQQDSAKPVTYDRLINFLGKLEQNRRTAQVSSVTVQPNPQDRNKLTFNLTINVYIKP